MRFRESLNKRFAWFGKSTIPSKYLPSLSNYFSKAGITKIPFAIITKAFILATLATLIVFFVLVYPALPKSIFGSILAIPVFVIFEFLALIISFGIIYYYFNMKIFRRTMEIERVLPDYLDNLKLNIGEGMAFEQALIQSVEPEYGVLANEIEIVSKKSMTGVPTEDALKEFSQKYKSNVLKEAVDVLIIAMKEGADIVDTLDKIVESIRTGKYLVETVAASVSGFVIFITLVSVIIAPVLYALSLNLLFIFKSFAERLAASSGSFFTINPENLVSKETFTNFSRFCIGIVAFFSSLIIANLRDGSLKAAAKQTIIFLAASLLIYEGARILFSFVFAAM